MSFQRDLKFGQKFEQLYCNYAKFTNFKISEYRFSDYDIIDYDTNTTYEVKADRLSHKTGNIVFEYECNNKPSGITTTKANIYVYFNILGEDYEIYEIPVYIIKSLLNDTVKKIKGGDKNHSLMYVLKLALFEDYKV